MSGPVGAGSAVIVRVSRLSAIPTFTVCCSDSKVVVCLARAVDGGPKVVMLPCDPGASITLEQAVDRLQCLSSAIALGEALVRRDGQLGGIAWPPALGCPEILTLAEFGTWADTDQGLPWVKKETRKGDE